MPKTKRSSTAKKAVSKTTKKVASKAAKVTKKSTRVGRVSRPASTTQHPMTKQYLEKEHNTFYAAHPNIKPLLVLFMLVSMAAFVYIIQVRYGMYLQ